MAKFVVRELALAELRDRDLRRQVAELAVLLRFDGLRQRAWHDYGCGQRGAELSRRRSRIRTAGTEIEVLIDELTPTELLEAFRRVAGPHRARTPSTRRTIDTWHRLELELERRERMGSTGRSQVNP